MPKKVMAKPLRYQHFKGEPNVRRSTPGLRRTTLVLLAAALILALSGFGEAATINANSASQSAVAAAIASAADGDILTIPSGTATWTRTLVVRKAITLQGAGVGVTIIKDGVQSGQLIAWSLAAGLSSRLTGIEFQDGGRSVTANAPGGILHVDGSNTDGSSFRWDHCKWNTLNGVPVFDTVIGVVDHNSFIVNGYKTAIYIYGSHWNGHGYGDGSWAAPTEFGSSQFLFIEDNTFTDTVNADFPVTDAHAGARFVVRHNSITNGFVANHGTESTGRVRGCRAMEVYNNTFSGTNLNRFVGGSRSGGALYHHNNISGYWGAAVFTLQNFRHFMTFPPWAGADGVNVWDVNSGPFFTGTATSNSSGTTVTVSGANWTLNQWFGHTIRRTTNLGNVNTVTFGWILSNTANTITYTDNGGYPLPSSLTFAAGDSLEIRKVDHAIDQPGRAQGSLISGDNPTPTLGWNNQVTEPCYSWNNVNTDNNTHSNFEAHTGVRANAHYFNDTPMPGYTPYVYPHPLTTGLPLPAQMTRKAAGNSQPKPVKERQPWGGKKIDRKKTKKAKASRTNEMADGAESLGH
jgi:hypothetical protein